MCVVKIKKTFKISEQKTFIYQRPALKITESLNSKRNRSNKFPPKSVKLAANITDSCVCTI